jgi:hypothetical protein
LRYNYIRKLAALICATRTGLPPAEASQRVDHAFNAMLLKYRQHITEADRSGVISMLESGRTINVRPSAVFGNLGDQELSLAVQILRATWHRAQGYMASELLKARASVLGYERRPLGETICTLTGDQSARGISDHALALTVRSELVAAMPAPGNCWTLPDLAGLSGWRLRRLDDYHNQTMFVLENENPAHPCAPKP